MGILIPMSDWQDAVEKSLPKDHTIKCMECEGHGEVEIGCECGCPNCNHFEVSECSSCEGEGVVKYWGLDSFERKKLYGRTEYLKAAYSDLEKLAGWTNNDSVIMQQGFHPFSTWEPDAKWRHKKPAFITTDGYEVRL